MFSYFTNRKEKVRINELYSVWKATNIGVPLRSVLGPLLLNILIDDMFYIMGETVLPLLWTTKSLKQ